MAECKDEDFSRSLLMGSEVGYDFTCHPCGFGGRNIEACGYCQDCGVYLCGQCITHHKALPTLAHHQIIDKDKMPNKQDTLQAKIICTKRCDIHKDEIVKYFCPVHQVLGCTACITLNHPACKNVEYIPEAAAGLEDKAEYKRFKKRLDDLIDKSKETIKHSQDSLERVAENYTEFLKEIEAYQEEINVKFDILKEELKYRVDQMNDTDTAVMNSVADEGNKVLFELEAISNEIEEHLSKQKYSDMYMQMKNTQQKLNCLEERLEGINKPRVPIYLFQKNPELQTLMASTHWFGTLIARAHGTEDARHLKDINVKSAQNGKTTWISGIAVLSNCTIAIVDRENETIKLINTDNRYKITEIISELKTADFPRHITKVDGSRLAVTLPRAKTILMVTNDRRAGLLADRTIKVNAECWGIGYIQGKLVVSFTNPAEVRLLGMDGKVLQTFSTDDKGNRLFHNPAFVSASPFSQHIYVSDWKDNKVTLLDMTGKVKAVYKDDELNTPCQLSVGHLGNVYVCGHNSKNIHLLTADCKKVKVILRETDGLKLLESVGYCEATQRLYVGMFRENVVKIYQLA